MATEEPSYQTLRQEGDFEIRRYAPMLIAETTVEGDMDAASNTGFRRIADFIFGNNRIVGTDASSRIAMTAPVTQTAVPVSVDMSAPVSTTAVSGGTRVQFVLPKGVTLITAPEPIDTRVQLRVVPVGEAHRAAARDLAARLPYRVEVDESDETSGVMLSITHAGLLTVRQRARHAR